MPKSDGYKNLKPLNTLTKDEQRKITQKGGIASAKKRRELRDLKEYVEMIYSLPPDAMQKRAAKGLTSFGIGEDDQNQLLLALLAMHKQSLKGNVRAMELMLKASGKMPADKLETVNQNYNLPTGITITYVDSDEPEHTDSASV